MRYSAIFSLYGLALDTPSGYEPKEPMPAMLALYYRELGSRDEINQPFNRLLQPQEILEIKGHRVFFTENQEVVLWGIAETDWLMEDPPVYASFDEGESWEIDSAKVSDFLVGMALWQAAQGGLPFCASTGRVPAQAWEKLLLKGRRQPAFLRWEITHFLLGGRTVVHVATDDHGTPVALYAGSRDSEGLPRLAAELDIAWD